MKLRLKAHVKTSSDSLESLATFLQGYFGPGKKLPTSTHIAEEILASFPEVHPKRAKMIGDRIVSWGTSQPLRRDVALETALDALKPVRERIPKVLEGRFKVEDLVFKDDQEGERLVYKILEVLPETYKVSTPLFSHYGQVFARWSNPISKRISVIDRTFEFASPSMVKHYGLLQKGDSTEGLFK
jgi:hypothetical protein